MIRKAFVMQVNALKAGWIKRWPIRVRRATRAPPAATRSASCIWRRYDPQGLCDAGECRRAR